jgi:heptosyltransferase-3
VKIFLEVNALKVISLLLLPLLRILTQDLIVPGVKEHRLQNILVVRTDRIGDVILTLPSIETLKSSFPSAHVSMLVSSYTSELVQDFADVCLYDREGTPKPFFVILTELHRGRFDAAIVAYPRFRIALLLWLAGIPIRVGTGYRWYSFFFNRKVFEHRKTVEKHEAEYNLSLLKILGCVLPSKPEVHFVISDIERQTATQVRQRLGIFDSDRLVLLHPGSGGSAHNWKPELFTQLAVELSKSGFRVIITGGTTESELVQKVASEAGQDVTPFVSTLSLRNFAAFIQTARLFIANSTGPLHIAAAVGIPVIGFYPPVKVMSPARWGPLSDKKIIFVPDPIKCPRCKGRECQGNDCMEQIEVSQVVQAVRTLIT